ncbi:YgdI/YgdR family lipoprotein [Leisingera sp. MMG026]|uniref:YgdI/YgdR family lipoprotein n=1 Tax=Leisingera sp. MMG026 TaxID=2909982 RepID=UPI001F334BD8|nr:YgdI/YgdR family lipoprotein [Leisingera sp. MMG026]MCF6433735.1 YgdI/YgdR family lipoprotein [Leisingera sp. MMG026]
MKTASFLGLLAAGSLFLSGCVSPDVVTTNNVDDASLTCEGIKTQMGQLDEIRAEAKKGKTASGKNVAAALLFWPAVIGNYANANEALEAANKRHEVLVSLAKKKRCKFEAA